MTDVPTTTVDFGCLGLEELDVLQRVVPILQPDEGARTGFVVSIEDGRRVWSHHRAGFAFTLIGEPADGTGRCVVPARLLSEMAHITHLNPDARLTVVDSTVHFGIGHHRLTMGSSDQEPTPVPQPSFSTSATVSGTDLYFALTTHCRRPYVKEAAQLDAVEHVMTMDIRAGEVVATMDWSGAGCFGGRSAIPATTSGPEWTFAVGLHPMTRVYDLLANLDVLGDGLLGSEWVIEMNDEDDDYLGLSCGPVRLVIERVPFGIEAAIPEIAEHLHEALGISVDVLDRTSVKFEYQTEQVCCEVFDGPDQRARLTIPIHTISPGSPDAMVAVLQELSAFNESHLGAFGFVDDGTVYACHVLLLSPRMLSLMAPAVVGLVVDAAELRECVQMAEAVSIRP